MRDEVFGDTEFVNYLYDRWGLDLLGQWAGNFARRAIDNDYFFEPDF